MINGLDYWRSVSPNSFPGVSPSDGRAAGGGERGEEREEKGWIELAVKRMESEVSRLIKRGDKRVELKISERSRKTSDVPVCSLPFRQNIVLKELLAA